MAAILHHKLKGTKLAEMARVTRIQKHTTQIWHPASIDKLCFCKVNIHLKTWGLMNKDFIDFAEYLDQF